MHYRRGPFNDRHQREVGTIIWLVDNDRDIQQILGKLKNKMIYERTIEQRFIHGSELELNEL